MLLCELNLELLSASAHYHQINDLKYSNKGDKFLVISGTAQAKLYERDGEEMWAYILLQHASTKDISDRPLSRAIHISEI